MNFISRYLAILDFVCTMHVTYCTPTQPGSTSLPDIHLLHRIETLRHDRSPSMRPLPLLHTSLRTHIRREDRMHARQPRLTWERRSG